MIDLPIFFINGLPRSGSTLLCNLLGQNPNHHVTPTSGLIELIMNIRANWKNYIEFRAEGLEKAKPRILGALKGVMYGFFQDEFDKGKVVFDKSRGWLNYIENLEEVLGKKIKVLVTVRDVRAIVASFEKIYRKRGIEYEYPLGEAFFKCQTIEGRSDHLLSPGGVVGLAVNRVRDAINRGLGDRIIVVPYRNFTRNPKESIDHIHRVLELPEFDYNPDMVEQITYENDLWHGMDLHRIQSKIAPTSDAPWEGILPPKYAEYVAKEYEDINKLARY